MVNANIGIFEMSYEDSVSYFKRLENLEKIRHTNGANPSSIPVYNKQQVSVTSSVGKSSKNPRGPTYDSNTTTWITMGSKFNTTKTGIFV
jgi:hypothetical protein